MLRSKFAKFLMLISKRQVASSPNFVSIFSLMKDSKLGQNSSNSSCQFWNDKSISLQILHQSSLSWHITPLWILISYLFYSGLKDPIKIPVLRLSSALMKICHIPRVIFQTTSQFFSNFVSPLSVIGQTLNTLQIRANESAGFRDLQMLRSNCTNFLSFLKQKISFSSNFASIFRFMRYNSSVLLS